MDREGCAHRGGGIASRGEGTEKRLGGREGRRGNCGCQGGSRGSRLPRCRCGDRALPAAAGRWRFLHPPLPGGAGGTRRILPPQALGGLGRDLPEGSGCSWASSGSRAAGAAEPLPRGWKFPLGEGKRVRGGGARLAECSPLIRDGQAFPRIRVSPLILGKRLRQLRGVRAAFALPCKGSPAGQGEMQEGFVAFPCSAPAADLGVTLLPARRGCPSSPPTAGWLLCCGKLRHRVVQGQDGDGSKE